MLVLSRYSDAIIRKTFTELADIPIIEHEARNRGVIVVK